MRDAEAVSWLCFQVIEREPVVFFAQLCVLGRATNVLPAILLHSGLEGDAVEILYLI